MRKLPKFSNSNLFKIQSFKYLNTVSPVESGTVWFGSCTRPQPGWGRPRQASPGAVWWPHSFWSGWWGWGRCPGGPITNYPAPGRAQTETPLRVGQGSWFWHMCGCCWGPDQAWRCKWTPSPQAPPPHIGAGALGGVLGGGPHFRVASGTVRGVVGVLGVKWGSCLWKRVHSSPLWGCDGAWGGPRGPTGHLKIEFSVDFCKKPL